MALVIDELEDNVGVTVSYLIQQGLLEVVSEDDEYFLTELPTLVGSETGWAVKKRKYRGEKKNFQRGQSPSSPLLNILENLKILN